MASGGSLLVSFLKPVKPSYQLAGLLGPVVVRPLPAAQTLCLYVRLPSFM